MHGQTNVEVAIVLHVYIHYSFNTKTYVKLTFSAMLTRMCMIAVSVYMYIYELFNDKIVFLLFILYQTRSGNFYCVNLLSLNIPDFPDAHLDPQMALNS